MAMETSIQRARVRLSMFRALPLAVVAHPLEQPRIRKIARAVANWPCLRASRDQFHQNVLSEVKAVAAAIAPAFCTKLGRIRKMSLVTKLLPLGCNVCVDNSVLG